MAETNHFITTSDISSVDKNFQNREMEAEISLNHSNAITLFQENCCKN
jgi:hypothetical protein